MKKFWMIAASVLLLAACEKEAPVQQETPNNENPATDLVTYTFKASINATKAYIDDDGLASGETAPLKWSDGDKIALYNSTTEEYVEFSTTLDADATSATFTAEAPSGAVFTKAYYPADYKGEGLVTYYNAKFKSDNNPLMSLSGARKCVVMEVAEIAANATSINFSQKGSMVKFTVSNVPDFAGKATLTFGDLSETVAIASTDISDGTSVFYFPVAPDHEKSMSFSLADTASKKGYNEFYRKARESATLGCEHNGTDWVNNPSLHRFTAKVGRVIMIDDKNKLKNSSFDELAVWKVSDNTKNYRFKMSNSYP